MAERTGYLQQTLVFPENPVLIGAVWTDNQTPELGEQVDMVATVETLLGEGNLKVFLGLRHDKEEKFILQEMFDDGNHNDGEAGDGNFGCSFTMTTLTAHYYVYAEIDEANLFSAAFSPARAEHEFYTLEADIPTAQPGDVAINELLARNNTDTVNEYGNHEDWIELVNLTDEPVDLFGLYLTDDFDNPQKFAFPANTIIQPGAYLMIWADEEDTVSSFLHANFKLSADGENLMLSDGDGLILDSLTFGPQTPDISWGRCPDGTGFFDELDIPTFGYENYCPEGYPEREIKSIKVSVVPNPFKDQFKVITESSTRLYFELFSASGIAITREFIDSGINTFEAQSLTTGMYFYLIKDKAGRILSAGKIMKL
jgi:hypothetical protein